MAASEEVVHPIPAGRIGHDGHKDKGIALGTFLRRLDLAFEVFRV